MQCYIPLRSARLVALAGTLAVAVIAARPLHAEDLLVVGAGPCTTDEGERCVFSLCASVLNRRSAGVACVQFVGGPSILLPNIRHAETVGEALYLESAQAVIVNTEGETVARANKPLLIIAEDVEGEALFILDDETINLRFEPGFEISIESLPDRPTDLLVACAYDRGTLLSLAVACGDEGRARGFGFVEFADSPAIPIEFFDAQISGRGRNVELELTGAAAVEIRGIIVLVPILVVLDPGNETGLISVPDIGVEAAIAISNLLVARVRAGLNVHTFPIPIGLELIP